jgi:hypothetical protein
LRVPGLTAFDRRLPDLAHRFYLDPFGRCGCRLVGIFVPLHLYFSGFWAAWQRLVGVSCRVICPKMAQLLVGEVGAGFGRRKPAVFAARGFVIGARVVILQGIAPGIAAASMIADITTEMVAELVYVCLGVVSLSTKIRHVPGIPSAGLRFRC